MVNVNTFLNGNESFPRKFTFLENFNQSLKKAFRGNCYSFFKNTTVVEKLSNYLIFNLKLRHKKILIRAQLVLYPVLILGITSGCAVSPQEVNKSKNEISSAADQALLTNKSQLKRERKLSYIDGNYLGDTPIELPYAASLPPQFFNIITLQSKGGGFGTVSQAARNIYLATGIPVRVNPDVELVLSAGLGSINTGTGLQPNKLNTGDLQSNIANASVLQSNSLLKVRLDFTGTLHSYLNEIANAAGVEWEYRDESIYFYRLITKTFNLSNISPGEIEFSDSMSKGGQAATGQTGSANGSGSNGSFSSTSAIGIKANYSFWKLLKPMLETASSPLGKIAMDEGSGTITITDTRDAMVKIDRIIQKETLVLGQQVIIDVRILLLELDKTTQVGIDLYTVYNALSSSGDSSTLSFKPPATQTNVNAGSLSFAVNNATSRFNGSNTVIQGLNQFRTIVGDSSSSVITTNRIPAMAGSFKTVGFLAQTTAAVSTLTGTGAPGLLPGSITTGSFLRILPTIRDNNTILINISVDISNLNNIGTASTGSGTTLQQIQWANTTGTKSIGTLLVNQDQSMVMVGLGVDNSDASTRNGVGGASTSLDKTKTMFVVIVSPRILKNLL